MLYGNSYDIKTTLIAHATYESNIRSTKRTTWIIVNQKMFVMGFTAERAAAGALADDE